MSDDYEGSNADGGILRQETTATGSPPPAMDP